MKRILITLCAFAVTTLAVAQQKGVAPQKADAVVKFTETKHNFGKIKQGVPVTFDFAFQNVGTKPAVIESATASCGCTTPTWPKTPVTKNKIDKISAGFNAVAPGPFDKTITVKVAGYDQPLELRISGEVLSVEDYAKYEATRSKKNG